MKIGIVSDIHEDAVNLQKAFTALEKLSCDLMVCLGDIVGFSYPNFGFFSTRNATLCIDMIRANCQVAVAGNHDLYAARRIPVHHAGFTYPPDWYELDYEQRKELAGDEVWLNEETEFNPLLSARHREFLMQLPEYFIFKTDTFNVLLSHYLYPDVTGSSRTYYERLGPVGEHLKFIARNQCAIGFSGHLHAEGARLITTQGEHNYGYETVQIPDETAWVVAPCVANGKYHNGYMIFDTNTALLEVIALNSPKRVMQMVYV